MATKFFLRNTAETVPISPTPDAGWEGTASFARALARTSTNADTLTSVTITETDSTDRDVLARQYIARLAAGQTITGSQAVEFVDQFQESTTSNNMHSVFGIRVIANDGVTVRKTILAVTREANEMVASPTALTNRDNTATSVAGNYTTVVGDHLVIEIGAGGDPAGANPHTYQIRLGDNGTFLTANDTGTTATDGNSPWVQLADTLTILSADDPLIELGINDPIHASALPVTRIPRSIALFTWIAFHALALGYPVSQPTPELPENPVRPIVNVLNLTHTQSTNLSLLYQFAVDTESRTPSFVPIRKSIPINLHEPPNLLTSTLSAVIAPFIQDDWPNPILPVVRILDRTHTQNLLQSTLYDVVFVPRVPIYTSLRKLLPIIQDQQPPNLLTSTLSVTAAPFSQDDWPNPLRLAARQDFVQRTNPNLFPSGQPFNQDDWPNPVRVPQRQDFVQPTNLGLLTAPPKPFAQTDYPNPIRSVIRPDRIQQTSPTLYQSGQPFSQDDWPNPTRATNRHSDWTLRTNPNLYQSGQPFSQDDWPNPLRPLPRQDFVQPTNLEVLTTPPKPFAQTEYPNPVRSFVRPDHVQGTNPNLFASGQPFNQDDWPNPRGYVPPITNRTWTVNSDPNLYLQPSRQLDWPNPRGAQFPLENRGFVSGTDLQLISQDTFFDGPGRAPVYDWPNPQGPRSRAIDLFGFTNPINLNFVIVIKPPKQDDWPNPRGAQFPIEDRGFVSGTDLTLISQDTFFDGPGQAPVYDWPNPQGPRSRSVDLFGFTQSLNLNLIPTVRPFVQTDWPNPRGYRRNPDWTLSTNPNLYRSGKPFAQNDWPNPIPYRRNPEWTLRTNPILYASAKPFKLDDWPNPLGFKRKPKPDLFSFVPPRNIIFYPPGGVPPVVDLEMSLELPRDAVLTLETNTDVESTLNLDQDVSGVEISINRDVSMQLELNNDISLDLNVTED